MPTDTFTRLARSVDFGVVVVPRAGDGAGAYCVGAAGGSRAGVGAPGVSGVGGGGGVFATDTEDHDER
jgi:hypothetical protein